MHVRATGAREGNRCGNPEAFGDDECLVKASAHPNPHSCNLGWVPDSHLLSSSVTVHVPCPYVPLCVCHPCTPLHMPLSMCLLPICPSHVSAAPPWCVPRVSPLHVRCMPPVCCITTNMATGAPNYFWMAAELHSAKHLSGLTITGPLSHGHA